MNPIIVITYKDHQDFRCPRGCCHEGSSYAIFEFAIFLDKEAAADHIAKANFEHSLNTVERHQVDPLTHRVLYAADLPGLLQDEDEDEPAKERIWNSIDSIPNNANSYEVLGLASEKEAVLRAAYDAKVKAQAEAEAAAAAEEQRKEKEQAKIDRKRRDREEFERLKAKFG